MISALILDTAAAIDEVAREEAALLAGIAEGRLTHHAVTAARVVITACRHEIATQLWSLARRASEHGLPSPGFDLARASDAAHVVTSVRWATCLRDWHRELERRRDTDLAPAPEAP